MRTNRVESQCIKTCEKRGWERRVVLEQFVTWMTGPIIHKFALESNLQRWKASLRGLNRMSMEGKHSGAAGTGSQVVGDGERIVGGFGRLK